MQRITGLSGIPEQFVCEDTLHCVDAPDDDSICWDCARNCKSVGECLKNQSGDGCTETPILIYNSGR